jgi:hypothetical protein
MEKRRTFGVKAIIPIATAAVGLVFLVLGFGTYGFWSETSGPLPGFFPSIIGITLIGVSAIAFLQSLKDERQPVPVRNWFPAIAVFAIIVLTMLIGMLPSLALFLLFWIRFYEKYPWKTTIITSLVILAIVVGVFMFWLNVPFPRGIIFDALAY